MSDVQTIDEDLFPEEAEPRGFSIDTLEKAEWALDKIGKAENRIQRFTELVAKRKTEMDARLAEVTKPDRETVSRMGEMIRPWAELEIAKAGKRKSMQLMGGEVGFRQSPARLEVDDPDAAVVALEAEHPECVRVKKEVAKTEVKKLIESTGMMPAGVRLVAGEIRFYIEAGTKQIA